MIVQAPNNGQEYRLVLSTIRKYIYTIGVYTKVAMIHQLSIPYIRIEKAVLLTEIAIKPQMAVKQCCN